MLININSANAVWNFHSKIHKVHGTCARKKIQGTIHTPNDDVDPWQAESSRMHSNQSTYPNSVCAHHQLSLALSE
jgi:hypothetical protein